MQPSILLTHGAGSNRDSALLVALDAEFTAAGFAVMRVDLAFRKSGKGGAPRPADQAIDRQELAKELEALRTRANGAPVYFGGHSYGGRQGSMLLAERPELVDGLLLLAYPLHPPAKPEQLRTAHFPALRTPVLFISGAKDEFGSEEEFKREITTIPARKELRILASLRHDLGGGKKGVAGLISAAFQNFVAVKGGA